MWKRLAFSIIGLVVAAYLAADVIAPASIADPWYPQLLMVAAVLFAAGILPIQAKLYEQRLLAVVYAGFCFLIAVQLWMLRFASEVISYKSWFDLLILLFIAGGFGWVMFMQSRWGERLAKSIAFRIMTLTLITVFFFLLLGEFALRRDLVRHHFTGAHPDSAAPEYLQARQALGAADFTDLDDDAIRILLIGDSVTYGDAVFSEDRYSTFLQELAPEDVQIIVLAAKGASTADELQLWRWYGVQLEPDIVIVGLVTNDPDMQLIPQAVPQSVFVPYFPKSQFAYYLDYQIFINSWLRSDGLPYADWEDALYSDSQTQSGWHSVVEMLYQEISETGALPYAYTLINPWNINQPEIRQNVEMKYLRLTDAFQEAGFNATNLFPAYTEHFGDRPYKDLCAFPDDCHPGREIHRFYAERIWQDIAPVVDGLRG